MRGERLFDLDRPFSILGRHSVMPDLSHFQAAAYSDCSFSLSRTESDSLHEPVLAQVFEVDDRNGVSGGLKAA